MMKRKIIDVHYNVDTNEWCTENGSPLMPRSIPRFGLYDKILLIIHFVHNLGSEVEDFVDCNSFSFVGYDEGGSPVIRTINSSINTDEISMQYEYCDSNRGVFGILVDCNTIELLSALGQMETKKLRVEFIASSSDTVMGVYKERAYFDNAVISGSTVNELVHVGSISEYTLSISQGDTYRDIIFDKTSYNLLSIYVDSPVASEVSYAVSSLSSTGTGFRVFFNATIEETGHTLRYALIRKA